MTYYCKRVLLVLTSLLVLASAAQAAKPLKIYIMSGQSNMEGHGHLSTFDYIGKDPKTAPLLKEMRGTDGKPTVCDDVWISYYTGWQTVGEAHGKLTAGYGARGHYDKSQDKIGPEFMFGITMDKMVDGPVLIIKTAWGGKSLHTDFRPPSAGPYKLSKIEKKLYPKQKGHGVPKDFEKWKKEKVEETGKYYHMMIDHVRNVLGDIKRVCPAYDEKDGYEIAGFVWFQGWNDMCANHTYPDGHKGPEGYKKYTEVMGHFIRDVRKELNAPDMKFVVGAIGVGGFKRTDRVGNLRLAMTETPNTEEFKGNVAVVQTAAFWDYEMEALERKFWIRNLLKEDVLILNKKGVLYYKKNDAPGFKPIGKRPVQCRDWHFMSFDPQRDEDVLDKKERKRFRNVQLPAGLEKWNQPGFDDSQWFSGHAPIGTGDWPLRYHKDANVKNRSDWGTGEFLLARTTFELDNLDYDSYRLSIMALQGFDVYLNGHKINTYIWWKDSPHYRRIPFAAKYLKKGTNVLAAYANVSYHGRKQLPHASIDMWVEGLPKADKQLVTSDKYIAQQKDKRLGLIFTQHEKDLLEGSSNGGYHYLGSAKIIGQIGKAFAEAMVELEK